MSKTNKNEVVVAGATDLALVNSVSSDLMSIMGADEFGSGFENADKDSYAIPFLQILQKMSPLVDEDNPRYVAGAKAGMLYNTVTGQLFDGKEGFQIVPCFFKRSYIEWAPRDAGGGFFGEYTVEAVEEMINKGEITVVEGTYFRTPQDGGKIDEKKTHYFSDTRSHYVVVIDPKTGETGTAILSLASSQIKPSRGLMTALQQKRVDTPQGKKMPPMYLNLVKVTTVGQQNDQGSWSGINFALDGLVNSKDLFETARDFYKAVSDGSVKADYSKAPVSEGPGGVSDKPAEAEGF